MTDVAPPPRSTLSSISLTLPAVGVLPVSLAVPDIAVRVATVSALVLKLAVVSSIGKAHAGDSVGSNTLLNPLDDSQEDVVLWILAAQVRKVVSNAIGAVTTGAVAAAADTEVAVELVKLRVAHAHGSRHVVVVIHRVVGADETVLETVPVDDLGAAVAELGQIALPGLDVEGVHLFGRLIGVGADVFRLPVGVVQDNVLEPFGRVRERCLSNNEAAGSVGARYRSGVDEASIVAVQGTENLADSLSLGGSQTVLGLALGADDSFGAILAQVRVLDNAVIDTVKRHVTLG
ncbi:hypothetical protein HG531_009275 [Fusarium graminearum]|nr:hypothetical protein HG531_009275 [Fusarium graminearum]